MQKCNHVRLGELGKQTARVSQTNRKKQAKNMKLTRTFQMIQIKVLLPCQLVRRFNLFYDHQDFRRKFSNEVGVSINF